MTWCGYRKRTVVRVHQDGSLHALEVCSEGACVDADQHAFIYIASSSAICHTLRSHASWRERDHRLGGLRAVIPSAEGSKQHHAGKVDQGLCQLDPVLAGKSLHGCSDGCIAGVWAVSATSLPLMARLPRRIHSTTMSWLCPYSRLLVGLWRKKGGFDQSKSVLYEWTPQAPAPSIKIKSHLKECKNA